MQVNHLDSRIGTDAVELIPSRNGYGEGLLAAGKANQHVVALSADLTESTRTNAFAEEFPHRFVQVGVAEQNMASVASGMAAVGKVPFIASYAIFSPGRNWEQIRTTIAYNDANVKIIGAHAGVSVGPDGATHQAIEDIAMMRVVPNMIVLAPADSCEANKMTLWAAEHVGPVYMRVGREKTPVVTTVKTPFVLGKAMSVRMPADATVAILSTGTLLHNAYLAAEQLQKTGTSTSVTHFGTIKPLDTEMLIELAHTHDLVVTVEEHQRAGGFGSAVAEYLTEVRPTRVIRIGVDDQFGQSGTPDELLAHYGMDVASIVARIEAALHRS